MKDLIEGRVSPLQGLFSKGVSLGRAPENRLTHESIHVPCASLSAGIVRHLAISGIGATIPNGFLQVGMVEIFFGTFR